MRLGLLVPIIGIILLVSGLTLGILPAATFNQITSSVGLTTTTLHSTVLARRIIPIIETRNFSYVSFPLREGTDVVGTYNATGDKVIVMGLNETTFTLWNNNRTKGTSSVSPLFYSGPAMNGTFSYSIEHNGTYYFVFYNPGEKSLTIIFSLNLVEKIQQPSADAELMVQGMVVVGLILALLGVELEIRHRRQKRLKEQQAEFDRLERVATSLGILSDGKTIEQLRKEIKFQLSKQEQQQK